MHAMHASDELGSIYVKLVSHPRSGCETEKKWRRGGGVLGPGRRRRPGPLSRALLDVCPRNLHEWRLFKLKIFGNCRQHTMRATTSQPYAFQPPCSFGAKHHLWTCTTISNTPEIIKLQCSQITHEHQAVNMGITCCHTSKQGNNTGQLCKHTLSIHLKRPLNSPEFAKLLFWLLAWFVVLLHGPAAH